MKYVNTKTLCKLLDLPMSTITIVLARHQFIKAIREYKSPIICNKFNKNLLVKGLYELVLRNIKRNRSTERLDKALSIAKGLDWNE